MNKIRLVISGIFISAGSFVMHFSWISAIALHIFTIIFAFKASGFISAFISLIFPVLSQIYWFIKMWWVTGSFINVFSFYVITFLAWLLFGFMLSIFGLWIEPKKT